MILHVRNEISATRKRTRACACAAAVEGSTSHIERERSQHVWALACEPTRPGKAVSPGWPLSGIRGFQEVRWVEGLRGWDF